LPGAELQVFDADGTTKVADGDQGEHSTAQWTATGEIYYVKLTARPGNIESAAVEPLVGTYNVQLALLSSLPGDYSGDGDLDGSDFLTWQRLVGQSAVGAAKPIDTGFENYLSGQIDGQQGWVKTGPPQGSAVVQQSVAKSGAKALRVSRSGGDVRWGVPLGGSLPSQTQIHVRWDMLVTANSGGSSAVGPFFGVEARDDIGVAGIVGSLGVDATTLEVLYKRQGDSFFSGTGRHAAAGVWQSFALSMDFARNEYTVYFNDQPLVTTVFVDRGDFGTAMNQLTSAEVAAKATLGDSGSQQISGTAYFDNFRILDGASAAYITADGNKDAVVNAADLTIWRNGFGTSFGGVTFNSAGADFVANAALLEPLGEGQGLGTTPQASALAFSVQTSLNSLAAIAERLVSHEIGETPRTLRPTTPATREQAPRSTIYDCTFADLGQRFDSIFDLIALRDGAETGDADRVRESVVDALDVDWDAALADL
jgi:hypothetical protein